MAARPIRLDPRFHPAAFSVDLPSMAEKYSWWVRAKLAATALLLMLALLIVVARRIARLLSSGELNQHLLR
ncbi:hypothetical protein MKK69_12925 [Methylobacterium sp. J-026]|uniref:hypothetical protein n=1 Tax=Methylobacterium sp. J-026 TaxID=2836624 RepID=UPI001FBAD4CB|nr:hypothetical protein [Methylobacterium sp. J-026]MCJ2134954.1 hypothetical protein [Methylobacterium sp. J-026]